jgi:hypothetical protein
MAVRRTCRGVRPARTPPHPLGLTPTPSPPPHPTPQLAVPLRPLKDVGVVLMIKVLVGGRAATTFHVFELEIELPKFAMYATLAEDQFVAPASSVTFT